jgi:hypothetical protein
VRNDPADRAKKYPMPAGKRLVAGKREIIGVARVSCSTAF